MRNHDIGGGLDPKGTALASLPKALQFFVARASAAIAALEAGVEGIAWGVIVKIQCQTVPSGKALGRGVKADGVVFVESADDGKGHGVRAVG